MKFGHTDPKITRFQQNGYVFIVLLPRNFAMSNGNESIEPSLFYLCVEGKAGDVIHYDISNLHYIGMCRAK